MDKPIPLESLFKEEIFRIPDYQCGYAWQEEQFCAFWEDLKVSVWSALSIQSFRDNLLKMKNMKSRFDMEECHE